MVQNKPALIPVDDTYAEYETYEQYDHEGANKKQDEAASDREEDRSQYEIPYATNIYEEYQFNADQKKKVWKRTLFRYVSFII